MCVFFFFFKQKTAYEMRMSDWSSDVCSSDLEEEAVDTGPDPLVTAEKFAEMQALYDKAWDSLLKLGSSHPKTQAKREAVASHIMTLKLSPKIVDEITQNLRAKIDTVRQTEKSIMRICVVDAGMTREEFIKIYRETNGATSPEWVQKLIRAKRKYSSELNARQEEIYALQEHLRKMEGDNLVSLTEKIGRAHV